MVEIKQATSSLFPAIAKFLDETNTSSIDQTAWPNLFDYAWEKEHEFRGYVLLDGPNVVGFLSMIFATREIDGNIENFCNLSGWHVKEAYRDKSLLLLMPALRLANYTLTDFTPSPAVYRILKRVGFQDLDRQLVWLLPLPFARRWCSGRSNVCTTDEAQIERQLDGAARQIFQDHRRYKCHHLLLQDDADCCYVLFTTVQTKYVRYCYIHYLSNHALFKACSTEIRQQLRIKTDTPFIFIDSRLIAGLQLPGSYPLPFHSRKLYKSATLRPEQIDNLYSELILLNIGSLPRLTSIVRDWQEQWFGQQKSGTLAAKRST